MQEHFVPAAPIQAKPVAAVGLEVLGDFWLSWTGSVFP